MNERHNTHKLCVFSSVEICIFSGEKDPFGMGSIHNDPLSRIETACGSLLHELKIIWDDVGESEATRDKMLRDLEQECLDVFRKRVDLANRSRAQLRQTIADAEAELAANCSAMGELPSHMRPIEQKAGSLKEELNTILPQLEEMRKKKTDRMNQFNEVIGQIQKISNELDGSVGNKSSHEVVDDNDLTLRRLQELQNKLQFLQKQKSDRMKQILDNLTVLSSLCSVLGLDFKETVSELHPSLADSEEGQNISTHTLQQLESAIKNLRELKLQRKQRLQDLGTMLLELWNLLDTPIEEQQAFQHVTCNIASSEDEITEPNMLSEDLIEYVEAEVCRLEEFKSSKMKELVLKKRAELEEICRKAHMVPKLDGETEHLIEAIESGALDPGSVLEQMELEVAKVKEEAFSRNEILEKTEKWLAAREEEEWLEEYNMDQNRYNTGRGSHLILKRAEKSRKVVNKIPGMVENLAAKIQTWEDEKGVDFLYDGTRLLSMLEEYMILRQEKEHEKKRNREQKKLQGQLNVDQEVVSGTKSSPMKAASKKISKISTGGSKRGLCEGNTIQTPRSARTMPNSRPSKRDDITGAPQSTVTRMLDKNFTFSGRETEPIMIRKPFSPNTSTALTSGQEDTYDDEDLTDNNTMQHLPKRLSSQRSFGTLLGRVSSVGEENCTMKEMHTSETHAPQETDFQDGEDSVEEDDDDEIKY